jgi:hypothetical protein
VDLLNVSEQALGVGAQRIPELAHVPDDLHAFDVDPGGRLLSSCADAQPGGALAFRDAAAQALLGLNLQLRGRSLGGLETDATCSAAVVPAGESLVTSGIVVS